MALEESVRKKILKRRVVQEKLPELLYQGFLYAEVQFL